MSLKRKAANALTGDAKKPKADGSITSFFGPPKTASSTTRSSTAAALKADGEAKVESTTTKETTITKEGKTTTKTETQTTEKVESAPAVWKEAWVKTLTEEQKNLLGLEINTLHESWLKELKTEITSREFLELKRFLKKEHDTGKKVFPPAEDVYSWFVPSPSLPLSSLLFLPNN